MITRQLFADTVAIGGSVVCALHCLVLPVAVLLLPATAALPFQGEAFHHGMLIWILPTSVIALTLGCRQHHDYGVFLWGASGLAMLIGAAVLGNRMFGDTGEKFMTVAGAGVIAMSHLRNHRLCRHVLCQCRTE